MARATFDQQMQLPPFQILLDSYGRDVHRFLLAQVGPVDAEDCYQETWIAALRGYPSLRHAENLRGWLLTIASRKAIDCSRARQRTPIPVAEVPEPTTPSSPEHAPDAADGDPWAAVRALPPKQRTAVALRYALDADYAVIAETMSISEDAARRNVHEGLKRLRKEYMR
ncbi:MAG: RNA polymerase sigma factor [Conexibacteraceae bacterium]|nr:RNA polymerase sigma factor [Conexibacteraceae bacterium]